MTPLDPFDELRRLEGQAYGQAREAAGAADDLRRLAAPHRTSVAWQDRTLARILDGWSDNGPLYRRLLDELDAVDVEQQQRTLTGLHGLWERYEARARDDYQQDVLPLCWEAIVKFQHAWPPWKLITFQRMLGQLPSRDSVAPLLHQLRSSRTLALRRGAGQALSRQPRAEVRAQLGRALDESRAELRRLRARAGAAGARAAVERAEEVLMVLEETRADLE